MFGRNKANDATPEPIEERPAGKGRATRRRADAQAARQRPLVSGGGGRKSKQDKEDRRAAQQEELARHQYVMKHAIEKHLPPRDQGKDRRFLRDYVDAQWNAGEFFMPLAIGLMIVVLLFGMLNQPSLYITVTAAMYTVIIVGLGNALIVAFLARKTLRKYFREDEIKKGAFFYAFQRAVSVRAWRQPRPQHKRGHWPQDYLTPLPLEEQG